jgi:hypothetical protein
MKSEIIKFIAQCTYEVSKDIWVCNWSDTEMNFTPNLIYKV